MVVNALVADGVKIVTVPCVNAESRTALFT
jgi:hypothetical protein